MRQDRRFQRKGREESAVRQLLAMAVIPLIVIVLMIVIVIADHMDQEASVEPEGQTEIASTAPEEGMTGESGPQEGDGAGGDTGETEPTEPAESLGEYESERFRKDSVPEIVSLMETYFQAREDSDPSALNRLYGKEDGTEAELEEERLRLRSNAKYVLGFDNISTYVTEAEEADTWLVYTLYDIRFHSVETPAPMIMWCFVRKDAAGAYFLISTEELTDSQLDFADVFNHSQEVRRLASSVNVKLKEALQTDEDLNEVYGVLRDGSPVYGEEEETQPVVVVEETEAAETEPEETEAEEETGAETGEESAAAQPGGDSFDSTAETIAPFGNAEDNPASQPTNAVSEDAPGTAEPDAAPGA